jgi:hypothetical protein
MAITIMCLYNSCGRTYNDWKVTLTKDTAITWNSFTWRNDTVNDQIYERTQMMVPLKIDKQPYHFSFHLNTGEAWTKVYWTALQVMAAANPDVEEKISTTRSKGGYHSVLHDIRIELPGFSAENTKSQVLGTYSENFPAERLRLSDTAMAGLLGTDLFSGKVLILDYPNMRFALCDTVPTQYVTTFSPIEITEYGQVILPMELRSRKYMMLFNTHYSNFSFLVPHERVHELTNYSSWHDTIQIEYANGVKAFYGEHLSDSFTLAGHAFKYCYVYGNPSIPRREERNNGIHTTE